MTTQTIPNLLKLLFSTFPPLPSEDGDAQLAAYAVAVNGHDIRDIEQAVHKLIRGEVAGHNPSFAPSAALLGAVIRERMNWRLDAEKRRNPVLMKPDIVHTPESRARVKALVEETARRLSAA